MLGAPRPQSAHARRLAGGVWRLQAPTPAGVGVIDQLLTHIRTRASREAHAGPRSPLRRGPPRAGARHAPHAPPPTLRRSPEYSPDAPPASLPHGDRRSHHPRGARTSRRTRRRPPVRRQSALERSAIAPACLTDSRPTPIEIPIPYGIAHDPVPRGFGAQLTWSLSRQPRTQPHTPTHTPTHTPRDSPT